MGLNIIIKTILEILGDKQEEGGYKFDDIPIFLNKDDTTEYPEIRVSPYIQNNNAFNLEWTNKNLNKYRTHKIGKFQVDIFCKNLAQANTIHNNLETRIYDFMHLETLIYSYNKFFTPINDNCYKNISYGIGDLFKDIHSIKIEDERIKRVLSFDDLIDESFFVNEDALFVKTNKNLKTIKIKVILQGRLFDNKDSLADRNIIIIEKNESRNLSDLENNEVERVSFDIDVLFVKDVERDGIRPVDFVKNKFKTK